jgi:hypothetical protein
MITGLTQITLPEATPTATAAIEALRSKIKTDREIRAEQRADEDRKAADAKRAAERTREDARASRDAQRDSLRERFHGLMQEGNAQSRGYLFETFLNDLFEFEALDPRRSFKLENEQIDGSFVWRGRANLVEAKWTKDKTAGQQLGYFAHQLEGKSADTRGLFVSVNGYTSEAIAALNTKGALKFVCIDGAHLMRALSTDDGLPAILERIWRHADETGEAYLLAAQL